MKLEDFEKLANAASREWTSGYVPISRHRHWQSIGPVTLGMDQAIVDADFTLACRDMVPKLINLAKEVDCCLGALEQLSIQPGSALHRVLKKVRAELEQT